MINVRLVSETTHSVELTRLNSSWDFKDNLNTPGSQSGIERHTKKTRPRTLRRSRTQDPMRSQDPIRTQNPMRTQDSMRTQDTMKTKDLRRIQDQGPQEDPGPQEHSKFFDDPAKTQEFINQVKFLEFLSHFTK